MLRQLTENEIKLLSIISRVIFSNRQVNTEKIVYMMGIKIPDLFDCWQQTVASLIDKNILKSEILADNKEVYEITEYGKSFAQYVVSNNCLDFYFYNEFYKRAEGSKAHALY